MGEGGFRARNHCSAPACPSPPPAPGEAVLATGYFQNVFFPLGEEPPPRDGRMRPVARSSLQPCRDCGGTLQTTVQERGRHTAASVFPAPQPRLGLGTQPRGG